MRTAFIWLVAAALTGCGGKGATGDPDTVTDTVIDTPEDGADTTEDVAVDTSVDTGTDLAEDVPEDVPVEPGVDRCSEGEALCLDHDTRRYCASTADGTRWLDEDCASGSGCVAGQCVTGDCSDECNLGETDGARTCELLDITAGTWPATQPDTSLLDRARQYNMWIRRDGIRNGGVGNAVYSDPPTYSDVVQLGGTGDSAIWTGTYLASEALRLMETGSADARENVRDLVETLHLWFNVAGAPGLLSRYAAPASAHPDVPMDCGEFRIHCDVEYEGTLYDYSGHISRDQYQGVMLGYALAYEALGEHDEAHRQLIREDVVELLTELMRERTVRVALTYNGTDIPAFDVTMRFAVLAPSEMDGDAIQLIVDTDSPDDSEMYGFQEFVPHYEEIIRQFPGLGWVPEIPRSGSAVMLASFFQVGLLVTDSVDGYMDEHVLFEAFYTTNTGWGGNVDDWLAVADDWFYNDDCGDSYYANNIVMEPMYNLARLEGEMTRRTTILNDVLIARMWPEFSFTKNPWFSYIYAASVPWHDASVPATALAQLSQFPSPPRIRVAVNLLADPDYTEREPGCDNQLVHTQAVDVGDRVVSDFIWQRNPWKLLDGGNPMLTYPGVDYMAAYWMGRFHGFIEDEPGTCLAWH